MKPVLRFSSMNSFRASCSDANREYRANQRLGTLFQIDFEVIRTIRRESFSFSFAENISKFVILGRNIGQIRSFYKFYRVSLNVQRIKTEFEIVGA